MDKFDGFPLSEQHWHVANSKNFYTDTQEAGVNKVLNSSCNLLKILYTSSPWAILCGRVDVM